MGLLMTKNYKYLGNTVNESVKVQTVSAICQCCEHEILKKNTDPPYYINYYRNCTIYFEDSI